MGMFSWICSDTERALVCSDIDTEFNRKNKDLCTKVAYCLIPKEFGGGCYFIDNDYDGYGVFYDADGKEVDILAALGRWNAPEECCGDDNKDRGIGIELYYKNGQSRDTENTGLKYPLKIVEVYRPYELSKPCWDDPNQGWGYESEEEDDDWEDTDEDWD